MDSNALLFDERKGLERHFSKMIFIVILINDLPSLYTPHWGVKKRGVERSKEG